MTEVPLLSPKPLEEMTPEEYKNYVKSLYYKVEKAPAKIYIARRTSTGKLSLIIRRFPKNLMENEIAEIMQEHKATREEIEAAIESVRKRAKKNGKVKA